MALRRHVSSAVVLASLAIVALAPAAGAQIAVSANDNKVVNVNGVVQVVPNAPPDTVSVIDLKASPPRVVAEVQAPVSVAGPPLSIALTPDQGLAMVTASNKVDPSDPTKQTRDNRVTVIDLKATPPKVIATLEAGKGAAGISINRQGTLALVSNLDDGTVSVFTIQGKTVTPVGTVEVGGAKAGGGMVAITPGRQDRAGLAQPRQQGLGALDRRLEGRVHQARHDPRCPSHRARHRAQRRLRGGGQPGRRTDRRRRQHQPHRPDGEAAPGRRHHRCPRGHRRGAQDLARQLRGRRGRPRRQQPRQGLALLQRRRQAGHGARGGRKDPVARGGSAHRPLVAGRGLLA